MNGMRYKNPTIKETIAERYKVYNVAFQIASASSLIILPPRLHHPHLKEHQSDQMEVVIELVS